MKKLSLRGAKRQGNQCSQIASAKSVLTPRNDWKLLILITFILALSSVVSYGKVVDAPVFSEEVLSHWDQATFANVYDCARYHWQKHASYLGKTPEEYTKDALQFFNKEKGRARTLTLRNGEPGLVIRTGPGGPGGYFTQDGRVVSFWYEYSRKRR